MTLWAIANQGYSQNDHANLDIILGKRTALHCQLWIFHSGDLRRVLCYGTLASRARYLRRCRLCCCHQVQHLKAKADSGPSASILFLWRWVWKAFCRLLEPDQVWMCRKKSPTCHSPWTLPTGSCAQSGNDSNTSKTEICVFIWNPPWLSKKLCQLQTKPEFPSFALCSQRRFAYIHQDHFQLVPHSSWKISFMALYYIIMEFMLCLLCSIVK